MRGETSWQRGWSHNDFLDTLVQGSTASLLCRFRGWVWPGSKFFGYLIKRTGWCCIHRLWTHQSTAWRSHAEVTAGFISHSRQVMSEASSLEGPAMATTSSVLLHPSLSDSSFSEKVPFSPLLTWLALASSTSIRLHTTKGLSTFSHYSLPSTRNHTWHWYRWQQQKEPA